MKTISRILLTGFGLVFAFNPLFAQIAPTDDIVSSAASSQGLPQVAPSEVPVVGATCWWVMPGGQAVPLPFLPLDGSGDVWQIAPQQYLVDQTGGAVVMNPRRFGLPVDGTSATAALVLADQVQAVVDLIAQIQTTSANQQAHAMGRAAGMRGLDDSDTDSSVPYGFINTPPDYGTNLWLSITSATNGVLSLVLSNTVSSGAAEVYEVMSTPDLTAGWNTVTEVWAVSNQNWIAFTLPMSSPTNLFLWAQDWTDEVTNGVPAWWSFYWFGNLTNTVDSSGNPLLTDYQNGSDPNPISFTVSLGNQHFNTTNATGSFLVLGGVPSFETVLVNDTNLDDAIWTNFDGTVHLNVGPGDGAYQVWFGLKGFAANATTSWFGTTVYLDRVAPQIIITSPVNNSTMAAPYVQVQGGSPEALSSVTYDLSNTVVVVANQPGFKTGHYVDTNLYAFTTNYFQCYDLQLANGMNVITVHVTDSAGNVAVTNLNVTLDYSSAVNPSVQLTWPHDGAEVCGGCFTVRGWTEDAASQVSATITDTNGDTNSITGVVDRTGVIWVESLPLNSGTNWVRLCVTNAAGLSSVTNFSVVQSSMTLTLTTIAGDLWVPPVNVGGWISDANAPVWVNGVQGVNNGDGTWNAFNVPVTSGGVASFDMSTVPPGGADPDASTNVDKPTEIVMDSDTWNYTQMLDAGTLHTSGSLGWSAQSGGFEHDEFHPGTTDWDMNDYLIATNGTITVDHYYTSDGTDECFTNIGAADMPMACGALMSKQYLLLPNGSNILFSTSTRSDDACMMLHTGGKPGSTRMSLFLLGATATAQATQVPYTWPVPPQQITVAGCNLNADGMGYGTFPDNSAVECTPETSAPYYSFTVAANKQCLPQTITFDDNPSRPFAWIATNTWNWTATLQAICPDTPGSTNPVVDSVSWGLSVDTDFQATQTPNTFGGTGANQIIITQFTPQTALSSNGVLEVQFVMHAYYTGCCDNYLKWIPTVTSDSLPIQGEPPPPFCDNPSYGKSSPYAQSN